MTVSPWVARWSHLVVPGATVLDLACGEGRHTRWFASRGARVTAIDRNAAALVALGEVAQTIAADLEQGAWPLDGRRFDAVVVTNYLWRPRLSHALACVAPGGVFICETFAEGNARFGRPSNPDFLLRRGELLQRAADLQVVAFEDGVIDHPPRCVQRLVARRPGPGEDPSAATALEPGAPGVGG